MFYLVDILLSINFLGANMDVIVDKLFAKSIEFRHSVRQKLWTGYSRILFYGLGHSLVFYFFAV